MDRRAADGVGSGIMSKRASSDEPPVIAEGGSLARPASMAEAVEGEQPEVGDWFWYKSEDCEGEPSRWLGCVTHIGSNYVQLEGVHRHTVRVHFDEFWGCCERETDADTLIVNKIESCRQESQRLMAEVYDLTARLALTSPALGAENETQNVALVLHGDGQSVVDYKTALVEAQKKTLPDLFKAIENANESMGRWMKAKLIPFKAKAESMRGVLKKVEGRIFNVELYAGLVEEIAEIADGDPAPVNEKLRLMQRRCYMDEECLARYEVGGMDFKDIGAFDRWLARPEHRDRILPFPRCIVAFRVRRNMKEREVVDLTDFVQLSGKIAADKITFLYIRNGDRLCRLSTEIEFGSTLFPDFEAQKLFQGQLYAKRSFHDIGDLISEHEYQGMVEDERLAQQKYEQELAQYKVELAEHERKEAEGTLDKGKSRPWYPSHPWVRSNEYVPFSKDNVYYDDISKKLADEMEKHNRLVLVLQGLLDRSPVLHPHPPWQLWTAEGFAAGLELVFDESRTLVAGDKPDFEAYRARLNASLKAGSITVGQENAWELHEGRKESDRMDRDWRTKGSYRPTRCRPPGDPGPGRVARVARFTPNAKKCTYEWDRERRTSTYDDKDKVRTTFTCDADSVLNVDAYKPGDFRIFFDDPRTRTEYLRWAPLLLEAEEYHAGNRTVEGMLKPAVRKKTREGAWEYEQRKRRKAMHGKAVRIKRRIETRGGAVYEPGSLWRVGEGRGDLFTIVGITSDGKDELNEEKCLARLVRDVHMHELEVDPTITPEPRKS